MRRTANEQDSERRSTQPQSTNVYNLQAQSNDETNLDHVMIISDESANTPDVALDLISHSIHSFNQQNATNTI